MRGIWELLNFYGINASLDEVYAAYPVMFFEVDHLNNPIRQPNFCRDKSVWKWDARSCFSSRRVCR